jgi:hypothetical protein
VKTTAVHRALAVTFVAAVLVSEVTACGRLGAATAPATTAANVPSAKAASNPLAGLRPLA